MAIKKLTFSFDVEMPELLAFIAARNSNLRIDVMGDKPKTPKALNGTAPKMLEGPRGLGVGKGRPKAGVPSWQLILKAMVAAPEHTTAVLGLRPMMESHGLSDKSISPQITNMIGKGFVKRIRPGVYQATAKGVAEAAKLEELPHG
jgi:hypothetical protein